MRVLAVDVGGTKVKALLEGEELDRARRAPSGPGFRPEDMLRALDELVERDAFERVTLGLPAPVRDGELQDDPKNLGPGWKGFDFERALGRPVRLLNDAAMQALGSYRGGRMLFLGLGTGLGTGLGSAMVADGALLPLELAHLPYRKGRTYEDELGARGLERHGKPAWRRRVIDVAHRFRAALQVDHVVLGGGNAKKLDELPDGLHRGDNRLAFIGGFRAWRPF